MLNKEFMMNEQTHIGVTALLPRLDQNLMYIFRLSNTVRLLAGIDIFFGFFTLFFSSYSYITPYIFIRILCGINGYYGAKSYNYRMSIAYSIYLALGALAELVYIYVFYYEFDVNKTITEGQLISGIILQVLLFMLKAYITRFVCKFTSSIKNISYENKKSLISYESSPVEYIFW